MIEVECINNVEELAGLESCWRECLSKTGEVSFFHTLECLQTYWRHFGVEQQMRVLVVKSAGRPVGMVPLCVRKRKHRFGKVRVLCYPFDECFSWHGPIGENREMIMSAVARYLRRAKRDWDVIELRATSDPTGTCRATQPLEAGGLTFTEQPQQLTSLVDFTGTWESYVASKPKKVRHEIRRIMRKVFEQEQATYIRHRPASLADGDGDPRWDIYDMCERVAKASWQARSNKCPMLNDKRIAACHREAHAVAVRFGMVDMNVLLVNGKPVAFSYSYCHAGKLIGLRLGYDTSASPTGFGRALVLRSLQDSFQRGDKSYHLGLLDSRLKSEIQTRTETAHSVKHLPASSWKAAALRMAAWLEQRHSVVAPAFGQIAIA